MDIDLEWSKGRNEIVGCIIHNNFKNYLSNWEAISEQIMTHEYGEEKYTIIAVYAPNDEEKASIKDNFFEELSDAIETVKGKIYFAWDFNE